MKSICVSFFILTIIYTAYGKPAAGPTQCFDAPTNYYWAAGSTYNPIGQCVSLQCKPNGQRLQIGCPIVSTEGCKKKPVDLRKQYPQCCPTCV